MSYGENSTERDTAAIEAYLETLRLEERSGATLKKYGRILTDFLCDLDGRPAEKLLVIAYKKKLTESYRPATVNTKLAAINGFLQWQGCGDCRVKALKIQRRAFCERGRELAREEYIRLLAEAKRRRNFRLWLLIESLGATGIRVSEHRFLTVEAARTGRALVSCKGKTRIVFLPKKLCRHLLGYCKWRGITAGSVFITSGGKPMDRSNIWHDMKTLCIQAAVSPEKVFPHNLRHLFARTFYTLEKDINRLADLLGHSNINTTRLYTVESGDIHERKVAAMKLLL